MFGIQIDGETDGLCETQSAVNNVSKFKSTRNKEHVSILYNAVNWAVAVGIMRIDTVDSNENLADTFTKRLSVITNGISIWKLDLLVVKFGNLVSI